MPYEPDEWLAAVGIALKEARQERGLSQERLGLNVGKPGRKPAHRNYVGEIERGLRNPSVRFIVELVNELDGDMVRLFARAGELLATTDRASASRRPVTRTGEPPDASPRRGSAPG